VMNDDRSCYLRVVCDKLDASGSLACRASRMWLFGAGVCGMRHGRRWLATPARGGSAAIAPGFGRGRSLGAVRRGPLRSVS
jgi:hypothetical protein